jgi:hypothetical protein
MGPGVGHVGGASSHRTCPSGQVAHLLGLIVALAPAAAAATNPWLTPLGSEAAMSGGAVATMGRDTGNAWYNPAGLGANTRSQFNMSSTLAVLRYRVIPGAFRVDVPGGSASSSLTSLQPLILATSTVYTRYLGRGVTVGGGHFANNYDFYDYSGKLTDLEGKLGTAYDTRVQVDGWSTRHHFGPTIGWQIRPRIRVGMSLFVTYEWQRDEGRLWAKVGPDAANIESNYVTGDIDVKRSTYAAEAVFGLQWEFIRNFHLGFAVRTPRLVAVERVRHYEVVTRGVKLDDGHYSVDVDTVENDDSASTRRGRTAPVNVVLGVAYALPRDLGWLSVEGDYSPALQHVRNDVDLRHTVNGRIGARIRAGEAIIVGLGGFTDRATQTGVQTFPQFNISYYGGSMGLEFRRKVKLGAHERARDIQFLTAIAVRYAFGTGQSGTVTFNSKRGLKWPIVREYGVVDPVQFHVLGAHLGAGFYF